MLGVEAGSSSRVDSALNGCTLSPGPQSEFLMHCYLNCELSLTTVFALSKSVRQGRKQNARVPFQETAKIWESSSCFMDTEFQPVKKSSFSQIL